MRGRLRVARAKKINYGNCLVFGLNFVLGKNLETFF